MNARVSLEERQPAPGSLRASPVRRVGGAAFISFSFSTLFARPDDRANTVSSSFQKNV
jgi:hypothetical protein